MSLLAVEGLGARLGGRRVLDDIGFTVEPGEFVGLIGPNGAGKSTLMRCLLGLLPGEGHIALSGEDASRLPPRQLAERIAYLAQDRDVAWAIPVEMLVALGRGARRPLFAGLTAEDRRAVDAAMARMEIDAFRKRPVTDLSGGERARVLIARALAQETPLLLADEPTAGLDPAHQITVMRHFSALAQEGRSVIASLHDLGLAARWCSRVILLDRGRLVADGAPAEVLDASRLADVYGVRAWFGEGDGGPLLQVTGLSNDA